MKYPGTIILFIFCMSCTILSCSKEQSRKGPFVTEESPRIFTYQDVRFDVSLVAVECPEEPKERYGPSTIQSKDEKGKYKYCFENNMLAACWSVGIKDFSFSIINKTEYSIRLIWDEAVYVDIDGRSQKIIHSGIKYDNRYGLQAPSVIARKAYIADTIIPSEKIYFGGDDWDIFPLFYIEGVNSSESVSVTHSLYDLKSYNADECAQSLKPRTRTKLKSDAEKIYSEKTIQVLLPLQIQDTVNDYIFIFKIGNARVGLGTPVWWTAEEEEKPQTFRDRIFSGAVILIFGAALASIFYSQYN